MRHLLLLFVSIIALSVTSCRNDFEFETSTGGLEFSKSTVYLDTVFTGVSSSTYTLKVYNRGDKDIKIPSIKLARPDSKYRLMVDGVPGTMFDNVELMAKDSMFVFIETTANIADANPDDFLYTDQIQFSSINGVQTVDLVTLIQDAVFIFPNRPIETGIKEMLLLNGEQTAIEGHELSTPEELHWTNDKPYVIYGYAMVPDNKTLTIDPGARVHFHANSGMVVDKAGVLQINGAPSATEALENEVIFEGDRLEPGFAEVMGQWGAILSISERDENSINHLTIKNATIGLLLQKANLETAGGPKMTINNTRIFNCGNFGILAQDAIITSENLAINNCGQASLAITYGGTYNFKHATIANYFNSFSQVPLLVNDYWDSEGTRYVGDLAATFDNCIIFGSNNIGMSLENEGFEEPSLTYNLSFNNCMIKLYDNTNELRNKRLYPFSGNVPTVAAYTNCIIAEESDDPQPRFENVRENDLRLSEDSEAKELDNIPTTVPVDIDGKPRPNPDTNKPDLGAFEYYVAAE